VRALALLAASLILSVLVFSAPGFAQNNSDEVCPRPTAGGAVLSPREIRSQSRVLRVALSLRSSAGDGAIRYCYVDADGNQSPTLRLNPGDLLILTLKNEIKGSGVTKAPAPAGHTGCASWDMQADSTNLHFHGLMIPPVCHQDNVISTNIAPQSPAFEYRVRIPRTQPPGLYWYHPHPHGHSEEQVLGGASGALIVEGIEHFNGLVAGLPERLLVIRDQTRMNRKVSAAGPEPPARDLSVNFVPVPYPNYPLAIIKTKPSRRELWRVLNASADTLLDLHLLTNGHWQSMGLVALDGMPLGYEIEAKEQSLSNRVQLVQHISLPPGGRAEFLVDTPPRGGEAQLLTSGVDTAPPQPDEDGPGFVAPVGGKPMPPDDDDYTPPRWLVKIVPAEDAPETDSVVPKGSPLSTKSHFESRLLPTLLGVHPVRERTLYFSERVTDPKNPRTSTIFYVTEEGREPSPYDPAAPPNITVHRGDVEDWLIENRSQEAHTFHIHQTHFLVLERDGSQVSENYLRDDISLPYWDGVSPHYPSVRLRMDFRNPAIVGTFPYHCHILQHEDGGMMGKIQVLKAVGKN
jgi:FtsP/CotA-like multicopper oxidase with cupredoxin domain